MNEAPCLYGVKIVGYGEVDTPPEWFRDNNQIAADLEAQKIEDAALLGRKVEDLSPEELKPYETNDLWIRERVHIVTRPIAPADISTTQLAIEAAKNAIENAGISPEQIGSVRLATVTPDEWASPPSYGRMAVGAGIPVWDEQDIFLHELIGCDQSQACCSFMAAFYDAHNDIATGQCEYALVVGADKMSSIVDRHSRAFYPILSDHAAGLVLKRVPYEEGQFLPRGFYAGGDGTKAERIIARAGGSRMPISWEYLKTDPLMKLTKLDMEGNEVFKELVKVLTHHVIPEALEKANLAPLPIAAIIPHQANGRMIDAVDIRLRKLGFKGHMSKTIVDYGNPTSASVPHGLIHAVKNGHIKEGDIVMLIAMGGGYTWRVSFIRW